MNQFPEFATRVLALFLLAALSGCEWSGYGYVNARSSPVRVVREDSGTQHIFTLAPRRRVGPFIHDRVPNLVTFYDSRGKKLGSVRLPQTSDHFARRSFWLTIMASVTQNQRIGRSFPNKNLRNLVGDIAAFYI